MLSVDNVQLLLGLFAPAGVRIAPALSGNDISLALNTTILVPLDQPFLRDVDIGIDARQQLLPTVFPLRRDGVGRIDIAFIRPSNPATLPDTLHGSQRARPPVFSICIYGGCHCASQQEYGDGSAGECACTATNLACALMALHPHAGPLGEDASSIDTTAVHHLLNAALQGYMGLASSPPTPLPSLDRSKASSWQIRARLEAKLFFHDISYTRRLALEAFRALRRLKEMDQVHGRDMVEMACPGLDVALLPPLGRIDLHLRALQAVLAVNSGVPNQS